jgi:hypothetical protein
MSHSSVRDESGLMIQSIPKAHIAKTDAAEPSLVTITNPSRSTLAKPSNTKPSSTAFQEACSRLHGDQKIALAENQGLAELFHQLDSSNTMSKEDSPFRRGVSKLGPALELLGGTLGLATPLAALDPVANTAFGIVQSVMKVR